MNKNVFLNIVGRLNEEKYLHNCTKNVLKHFSVYLFFAALSELMIVLYKMGCSIDPLKCFQLVTQVCRLYEGEDRDDPVTVQ
jgi:hypothetical protein